MSVRNDKLGFVYIFSYIYKQSRTVSLEPLIRYKTSECLKTLKLFLWGEKARIFSNISIHIIPDNPSFPSFYKALNFYFKHKNNFYSYS